MNNGEYRGREDKFSVQGSFFTGLSPAGHVSTEVTVIFHEWRVLAVWSFITQFGDVPAASALSESLPALNHMIPEAPCSQGSNELSYTIRNTRQAVTKLKAREVD